MWLKIRILLLFLFLITACTKKVPANNFNSQQWMTDQYACKNQRLALIPELEKIRQQLPGVTISNIQELLGKPEATSIADQSEKIFMYYLEPGSQCTVHDQLSAANKLIIRFNAMGIVKET